MAAGKSKGQKRPPAKRAAPPAKKRAPAKGSSPRAKAAPASRKGSGAKRPAAQPTRREKEARALRNRLVFGALALVVAGGVIFLAARPDPARPVIERLEAGAGGCDYDTKRDQMVGLDEHIPNPTFKVDPPAGGAHEPQAANPAFYRPGKAPSDGQLVHANQHGFIVLWYRPDLPPDKVASLEELSDEFGRELIVAPRPSLRGEVAVTAWHKRLVCTELAPEKVALFTRSFKDQGPEKGFL